MASPPQASPPQSSPSRSSPRSPSSFPPLREALAAEASPSRRLLRRKLLRRMRTTPLDCLNNTDGFFTQRGTKLPDTSRSTVNANLSLVECRALCFSNCSCTAYAPSNISGIVDSGCLIWTDDLTDIVVYQSGLGQDLYVRLAAADLVLASEAFNRHSNRKILMIVVLPLAILFLACVAYSIWRWKKTSSHIHDEAGDKDMELPLFDLNTIKDATDDFSPDNKLGEGGFGPVYKGKLGEEQAEIAVKRLSKTSTQGVDEFKNEILDSEENSLASFFSLPCTRTRS